jgi:WD40 repeat protein
MDGEVRLWDIPSGQASLPPLRGHQSRVTCVFFAADGKTLLTAGEDRTLRWWHVATGREMLAFAEAQVPSHAQGALRGLFSVEAGWNPGGNLLVWLEGPGRVCARALPTLQEIDALEKAKP